MPRKREENKCRDLATIIRWCPVGQKLDLRRLRKVCGPRYVEALLHEPAPVTLRSLETLLRQMKANKSHSENSIETEHQFSLTLGIFNFWWRYFTDMLAEQMITEHVRNFTVPPATSIDTVRVKAGYEDVRSDYTETQWAVFKYSDANITLSAKGKEFEAFKQQFEDNERCYGYIRFQTGDEMSKRTKFVLVTWIGKDVGVMHRAKVTNDKSLVKQVISNYAVEFQLENNLELDEHYFKEELTKIGGTKYGTGVITDNLK